MINQKITKLYGYHQLDKRYAALLRACQAKENTRYAINLVCSHKGALVTTDGRRLMELTYKKGIANGLYLLTKDGLLLPVKTDNKFPKYQDVLLKNPKRIKIKDYLQDEGKSLGSVLYNVNTSGIHIDLYMYEEVMKKIAALEPTDLVLEVAKKDTANCPMQFQCSVSENKILFVLMPFSG